MPPEIDASRQSSLWRTWELRAAFIFGLVMLIVPDLLGFYQSTQRGVHIPAVEIFGTALDAGAFLTVVYLLRRDLRKRREVEAELKRSNAELHKASRFKTELLGIAAHDLKNPLASLRALARLLLETPGTTKPVEETARHMEMVAEDMLKLVHELLETAALEGARLSLHLSLVELQELAGSAVADALPAARHKAQRIDFVACGPLLVQADSARLRQVFANLIGNAIKFSPAGTTITVRATSNGDNGEVIIRDEGPGLSPEDLAQAFGRFRRLSARPTGGESSTGLGLWIVREIVGLHSGRVWLTSEGTGRGTEAHVALPLAMEEAESLPPMRGDEYSVTTLR